MNSAAPFDLAEWCARIPGLRQSGENAWEVANVSAVSYPGGGHFTLAGIEEKSYWFNHRNAVIAAMIRNFMPDGPMFDIGGGNGYVSLGLKRASISAVVVEPGPNGAAVARERGLPTIHAAFQDLKIPDGSLPACGLFDVLEHIEDDKSALANLHRTLKPGGMLYLAVPAFQNLWSHEDVAAGHFRRYTAKSLSKRVSAAGFSVLYASHIFGALMAPLFAFRTIPSMLGSKKTADADYAEKAHTLPGGPVGAMIGSTFAKELSAVSGKRSLSFGTSCILAARVKK